MTDTTPEPVVIFYEVFTGTMPDGQRVMVQLFRKKGEVGHDCLKVLPAAHGCHVVHCDHPPSR